MLAAVVVVYLLTLIFKPNQALNNQSLIIEQMQSKNVMLRVENDSLGVLADSLTAQVNAPDPNPIIEKKYTKRNEAIEQAPDSNRVDCVIVILERHRAARLAEVNQ